MTFTPKPCLIWTQMSELYGWEAEAKFWRRTMNVPGGCLHWVGRYGMSGYGVYWLQGRYQLAHRISLQIKLGREIKPDKYALHKCNNRSCVNPSHLSEGSPSENNFDQWRSGTRYKIGPEKRAMLLADIRSGFSIPETCKKYGVNRNWYADHKRLCRLGKRNDS